VLPEDLREQLNDLLRQLLLVARALIDWWVSRLEAPVGAEPAVGGSNGAGPSAGAAAGSPRGEDIPIA
jgi:hypothetical protein